MLVCVRTPQGLRYCAVAVSLSLTRLHHAVKSGLFLGENLGAFGMSGLKASIARLGVLKGIGSMVALWAGLVMSLASVGRIDVIDAAG